VLREAVDRVLSEPGPKEKVALRIVALEMLADVRTSSSQVPVL
jgi:hypothetical protein